MWFSAERGVLRGTADQLGQLARVRGEVILEQFIPEAERLGFCDVRNAALSVCNGEIMLANRRMVREEKERRANAKRQDEFRARHTSNGKVTGGVTAMSQHSPSPTPDLQSPKKEIETTSLGADAPPSPIDLMEGWNEICHPAGLAKVAELSATRKKKAALRLHEHPAESFWNQVLNNIADSPFLRGLRPTKGHEKWKADFDWMIDNDTTVMKIYEGKYNG
jgi:hypothetical protein